MMCKRLYPQDVKYPVNVGISLSKSNRTRNVFLNAKSLCHLCCLEPNKTKRQTLPVAKTHVQEPTATHRSVKLLQILLFHRADKSMGEEVHPDLVLLPLPLLLVLLPGLLLDGLCLQLLVIRVIV